MNRNPILTSLGMAAALLWGVTRSDAQTPQVIGPVDLRDPTLIDYTVPNYANSPLPKLTGSLTGVRVVDGGCGYTYTDPITLTPTDTFDFAVTIEPPPVDGTGAIIPPGVQAVAWAHVALGSIVNIDFLAPAGSTPPGDPGLGYLTTPAVTLPLPTGATCKCPASAIATMGIEPGTGLRKFLDSLPGLGPNAHNNLGQFIPVAVPNTPYLVSSSPPYPGSEYYEIAVVEYRERMHSDLPGSTLLRGYVQLVPSTFGGAIPLTVANGLTKDILVNGNPAFGAYKPHYLGPLIVAKQGTPTRIKFYNLLPTGADGKLFLPNDTTIMGAGAFDINWNPVTGAPTAGHLIGNFVENRATLHLHGGLPPWISDGTPHQWTAPAGETTDYKQGISTRQVPDMPLAPGESEGVMTFYYPNSQSGRLMFYHDHAYGITRLNVYAGEAAGYLLRDDNDDNLNLIAGVAAEIPLVIQDKTFVWGDKALGTGTYAVDPLWKNLFPNSQPGDLWLPHVYMANQNPADLMTGANPLGRWDYGPWFWPPQTLNLQPMPEVSTTPESFMDTPLVNGTAYPYAIVPAAKIRFRILNACNDRFLNLQLYQADPNGNMAVDPLGAPTPYGTEVKMVPAAANPAIPFPDVWLTQTPGMIPEIMDNRPGGIPDPRLRGPAWVQIGTEAGLLPAAVVHNNTPVGYEQNKRNIVVLNVTQKTMFLGPAERADVIIDFSAYAGKTVILYNDSPAPVPAGDPRLSYYTGNEDYSITGGANYQGGAPSTLPGYGPNMRTIMQFRVGGPADPLKSPVGDETPLNLTDIDNAVRAHFVARAEAPIVPGPAYPTGTPGYNPTGTYSRIQDTSLTTVPAGGSSVTTVSIVTGGTGYASATTTVTIDPPPAPGTPATVSAVTVDAAGAITEIKFSGGTGYLTPPAVLIANGPGGTGIGATASTTIATMTYPMQPKAIHELFDDYGRMNSVLGVELPFTSFLIQTTIPYQYIDPITESIPAGETQIWKITHNGVDTHAIHFHLVNVQVINRVGWDGAIRPPDANELGWKETVRMNPLEDCIVAATAKPPVLPFHIGKSMRPLDVIKPLGTTAQFTGVNPANGTPLIVTNKVSDFDWEYVWHCHLLGHEENDMMRPLVMTAVADSMYYFPPTVTASFSPAANAFGWYNASPVTVTLAATPNDTTLAAVDSISISVNGGSFATTQPYTGPVGYTVSAPPEGITTITYFATASDAIRTASTPATAQVKIDLTVPTITGLTANPPSVKRGSGKSPRTVNVTGTITDALSGVDPASLFYRVVSPAGTTPNTPFTISATGAIQNIKPSLATATVTPVPYVYTIVVDAKDKAGNPVTASVKFTVTP